MGRPNPKRCGYSRKCFSCLSPPSLPPSLAASISPSYSLHFSIHSISHVVVARRLSSRALCLDFVTLASDPASASPPASARPPVSQSVRPSLLLRPFRILTSCMSSGLLTWSVTRSVLFSFSKESDAVSADGERKGRALKWPMATGCCPRKPGTSPSPPSFPLISCANIAFSS